MLRPIATASRRVGATPRARDARRGSTRSARRRVVAMAKARATKTRETRDDARVGLDAVAGARAEDAGEGRRETGTRDETRGDGDGDCLLYTSPSPRD